MVDVQNQYDHRKTPIDRVGVKNLRYPITVLDRANKTQHTIGSINMYVNLPHRFRGTHMSRFVEILNENHNDLHINKIKDILQKMKKTLHAEEAHIEIAFSYFIEKSAPVSRAHSLMEYLCRFIVTSGDKEDFILGVDVPITTLCPCSKEMSERGAHNQRSIVRIRIRFTRLVWIEELIAIGESASSSPLYALLKREDEKSVTEAAYDRPRFVEDVVREVSLKLRRDKRIVWYTVESENFESIHNHSAYASVERTVDRS